ncbi:MAG TPA: serine hydrolase [Longimicrobiales bacterium]|nr:serine hydrolase [Longimicrobiales bacterium]
MVAGGVAADGGAAAGVDAAALDRLVEASSDAHSHALVVIRGDSLVGTWYAGGERRMVETMSVTKSVLNLALGRLVTLGALPSIDVPVADYFPEWRETEREAITVRHLLNHTSGLADPGTGAIYASGDFVRLALESDLATTPGTAVAYNNNAVNLLAGLMCRAAGDRLDHFLAEDLFTRLGINQFRWSLDEAGNPHGMAGLQMYAEDLARLGQLVLRRGEWNGRQLIQSSWFDESLRPGSHLSDELGLLWWIIRDEDGQVVGYRADGYLGQYLVIYPEEELVAVRLVASSPAYDPDTDAFRDFPAMVMDLVR